MIRTFAKSAAVGFAAAALAATTAGTATAMAGPSAPLPGDVSASISVPLPDFKSAVVGITVKGERHEIAVAGWVDGVLTYQLDGVSATNVRAQSPNAACTGLVNRVFEVTAGNLELVWSIVHDYTPLHPTTNTRMSRRHDVLAAGDHDPGVDSETIGFDVCAG